jgi:hypothetical protein
MKTGDNIKRMRQGTQVKRKRLKGENVKERGWVGKKLREKEKGKC